MEIDTQAVHDLLTRQIDLLRYERSVRRDVLKQLQAMQDDIENRLLKRDLSAISRRELNTLLAEIEEILSRDYDLVESRLKTETENLTDDESAWLLLWLTALAGQYELGGNTRAVSDTAKQSVSDGILLAGMTLNEAVNAQKVQMLQKLKQLVRLGAVSDGMDIRAELAGVFKRGANGLTLLTGTWLGSLSSELLLKFANVNPLIKGLRHVSALDGKTSIICTARHGLMWDKQGNPIHHAYPFRKPPLHPHCRSKLVPVLAPDTPFEEISGEDWVKGRTLEQLQEQFGKGIGQMLSDGIITLKDAVRSDGLQMVSLQELRNVFSPSVLSKDFESRFQSLYAEVSREKSNGISLKELRARALNKIWVAGDISQNVQKALKAETSQVWFSDDTLIKQIFNHSDLNKAIYQKLPDLISHAETIILLNDKKAAFFKYDNDLYEVILKATEDRQELYVVSLFHTDERDIKRLKKKGTVLEMSNVAG